MAQGDTYMAAGYPDEMLVENKAMLVTLSCIPVIGLIIFGYAVLCKS